MHTYQSIAKRPFQSQAKKRAYSSNSKLTKTKGNQHEANGMYFSNKVANENKSTNGLFEGLSTADILLFYITMQANYHLSDHEYYPNIVTYYQMTGKDCKSQESDKEVRAMAKSRLQQTDIDQYPYDCLGLIVGKSIQKIGTACLVAPNLIITSASLVIDKKTGLPLKQLKFYPKINKNSQNQSIIEYYSVIDLRVSNLFLKKLKLQGNVVSEDYALLLLSKPIVKDKYIYIGYDSIKQNKSKTIGHQVGLIQLNFRKQQRQTGVKGKIIQIQNQVYTHDINSKKIYGGAPIIIEYSQGLIFTIGVHSSYGSGQNCACKITSNKAQNLKQWAQQLTSNIYSLTIIKMISDSIKARQKQSQQNSIELQIIEIQRKVDELRKKGESDELRISLGRLGQLCWKNGQFKRSISNLQQGLRVCNKLYKQESLESAFFHSNLGLNYDKLKEYELAYNNFKIALRINKKARGNDSLGVAVAYNNIGNLFKRKGKLEKALQYYNKSLKIKIKLYGSKSQGAAASLSNIALIEWQKKNYLQAIQGYKESLSIYRAIFGQRHSQISRTLYNLALCYYDISQYGLWLDKHFQSLTILQQLHLENHPSYNKRKQKFLLNLNQIIKSKYCDTQTILKAIKIMKIILDDGEQQQMMVRLQKKLQSSQ